MTSRIVTHYYTQFFLPDEAIPVLVEKIESFPESLLFVY